MDELDPALADRFARLTLGHLTRQWPYHASHVLSSANDLAAPCDLHPVFHGSFDWHSCVHGWWQVMRLARLYPDMATARDIAALADAMLVEPRVRGEIAFFERPMNQGFERPYGWAWLLRLHDELTKHGPSPWAEALEPLARLIAGRLAAYLPKLLYPIRSGKHDCTAFALVQALVWARQHDAALAQVIRANAWRLYLHDADARPWEPGGEDFLSATLCEAVLMQDVLPKGELQAWLRQFLPDPFAPHLACLRTPVDVSDRSDGRLAHLDGLNLSRAWCWRRLADALPDPAAARRIAADHLAAALPHFADDYMGEHWLATFALLALEADAVEV